VTSNRPRRYMTKARKAWLITVAMRERASLGGRVRAEKLNSEQRRAIATKASKAAAKVRTDKAAQRQCKAKK
jgi:hypothetical protein